MKYWNIYHLPNSVEEALQILASAHGRARVVGGGTDLFVDIQQGRQPPVDILVDVTRIPEMVRLDVHDDLVYLGAAVTHAEIVENAGLQAQANCLVQASRLIGGPQVRNVATIGGNVAHALPAGDGAIALMALQAEAELAGPSGRVWKPLGKLFKGPGEPTFEPAHELIVRFRFPTLAENENSAFARIMRPQGVAIAILNMAIWLRNGQKDFFEDIRIAVGPAGRIPFRARATEESLRGQKLDEVVLERAIQVLQGEARVRTSKYRATREYRRHLLGVLLRRVLTEAGSPLMSGGVISMQPGER